MFPTVTPTLIPTIVPTVTPCPYLDGGNGVTFYTGKDYTGQSTTIKNDPGQNGTVDNLPDGIAGNLGSYSDTNNAWHIVLYQNKNGAGNLGHFDVSNLNVDAYWSATQSVEVYLNRSTC